MRSFFSNQQMQPTQQQDDPIQGGLNSLAAALKWRMLNRKPGQPGPDRTPDSGVAVMGDLGASNPDPNAQMLTGVYNQDQAGNPVSPAFKPDVPEEDDHRALLRKMLALDLIQGQNPGFGIGG